MTLSPRQTQVRNMVVRGFTNQEIGDSLGISRRTVEDHRRTVMNAYAVRNAVELVRAVYQIGESGE